MKKTFALALLVSAELFGAPIFHINHLAMFNPDLGNQTGISLSALQLEFPQDLMITQGRLVGHLSQNFPGDLIVWTTPKTAWVEREEVAVERFIVPPLPPVPPVVPPTVDNPIQPPVVPPHHICYHNCHPEPPSSDVPEVSSGQIVLVAIGATFLLYLWGNRIEKRKKDRK